MPQWGRGAAAADIGRPTGRLAKISVTLAVISLLLCAGCLVVFNLGPQGSNFQGMTMLGSLSILACGAAMAFLGVILGFVALFRASERKLTAALGFLMSLAAMYASGATVYTMYAAMAQAG